MIFLQKSLPSVELLADGLDDVIGMAVGLGEDEGLGHFGAAREDLGQVVAEGADDGADLVGVDDEAVQLGVGVDFVLVLLLPSVSCGLGVSRFSTRCLARVGCRHGGDSRSR